MGELVHLRLEREMLKKIDHMLKGGLFTNRTEFIRDSIRKNIEEYEKRIIIIGLSGLKGKARKLTKAEQIKAKKELLKMSSSDLFRKLGLD